MSFVARNHPQQTRFNGGLDAIDDRATTPEVFAEFHARWNFTVDAAASEGNAKVPRYFDREMDGLKQSWTGERVWCNPPYSNIAPWIEKAIGGGAELVVLLLPANRTEQGWWQDMIEPRRRKGEIKVEFLRGRMRFIAANDTKIRPNSRPPFGVCLIIIEGAAR